MKNHNTITEPKQAFFKLFLDYQELFQELSAEQVGKLIRAVMEYGSSGTIPALDDEMMMHFLMMKEQNDQDLEHYENRCRQNSKNAKKRYENKAPTLEEVKAFFEETSMESDPEHFFHYYEARGWCVSGNQITNWQALAKAWEKNGKQNGKMQNYVSPTMDYIDWEDKNERK